MAYKFKIGDRVKIIKDLDTVYYPVSVKQYIGVTATIIAYDRQNDICLELDYNYGPVRHNCNGKCKAGRGLYVTEEMIELIEPVKELGRTVNIVMHEEYNNHPEINVDITSNGVSINRKNFDILEDDKMSVKQLDIVQALLQNNYKIVKPKPKLPVFITESELRLKGACIDGLSFFSECRDRYEKIYTGHYPLIDFMGALILDGHVAWYTWMVQKFDLNQSNALPSLDVYSILRHYSGLKEKYKEQENENK